MMRTDNVVGLGVLGVAGSCIWRKLAKQGSPEVITASVQTDIATVVTRRCFATSAEASVGVGG